MQPRPPAVVWPCRRRHSHTAARKPASGARAGAIAIAGCLQRRELPGSMQREHARCVRVVQAQLEPLKAPTLITWARDDRVTALDWALLPTQIIPKCERQVFCDCGQWAMIDRKEEFEATVLTFLTCAIRRHIRWHDRPAERATPPVRTDSAST
jgi:pimeloyl-ACP methyl ester carboxylesterase